MGSDLPFKKITPNPAVPLPKHVRASAQVHAQFLLRAASFCQFSAMCESIPTPVQSVARSYHVGLQCLSEAQPPFAPQSQSSSLRARKTSVAPALVFRALI